MPPYFVWLPGGKVWLNFTLTVFVRAEPVVTVYISGQHNGITVSSSDGNVLLEALAKLRDRQ